MADFSPQGNCANNHSHRIFRRLITKKSFAPNGCCSKCSLPFNKIYFDGTLVSAHYYECRECKTKICFNCALSANKCDKKWNKKKRLPAPCQQTFTRFPKIDEKWIKINNALDNMTKDDLKKTMKKVIKSLGGLKNTLFFITKNLSHSQLDNIHNLMLEQGSVNNVKSESEFEAMPNELLSHICAFLDTSDIKQFKLCSRKISLLCLQEMNKVCIGLMNGNEILQCGNVNPHNLDQFAREKRYNPKKLMSSIYAEWKKEINIPSEHQIIFKSSTKYDFEILTKKEYVRNCVRTAKRTLIGTGWGQSWESTLILDSTKITLLNAGLTAMPFDKEYIERNLFGKWNIARYEFVILQYFDVTKQTLRVVQYLLCEKCDFELHRVSAPVDLLQYIENNFVEIDGVDDGWYRELKRTLNRMEDNPYEPKLCLYNGDNYLVAGNRWLIRFTFQINTNHPWFLMNESKIVKRNDAINLTNFAKRFKTYRVSFKDKEILALCLQKHFDQRLDENEQRAFQPSLDVIFDFVNAEFVEIKVWNLPTDEHMLYLKQRIVKILDNIIRINQIHVKIETVHIGKNLYSAKCSIILPLSDPPSMKDPYLYKIQIFAPRDCPFPYQFGENGTKSVIFAYYQKYSEQLIDDLFETMASSPDHIYYDYYKELIDIYYENGMEKNENIECVLTTCSKNTGNLFCMNRI